jgi:hypothetical protein
MEKSEQVKKFCEEIAEFKRKKEKRRTWKKVRNGFIENKRNRKHKSFKKQKRNGNKRKA